MKPLIGITTGEIVNAKYTWAPYVYGQSHTYAEAIEQAGGIPVLLPFLHDMNDIQQLVKRLSGVMFSGGNDITPDLYGDPLSHAVETSRSRDEWELMLMKEALAQTKPLLTICRGMQLLNVCRGGTLYQDIRLDRHSPNNHSSSEEFKDAEHLAHKIIVNDDSRLASILGVTEIMTNSQHHQAVRKLGQNLVVSSRAEDGVVESIEDPARPFVVGVQSHPEGIFASAETSWRKLFVSFIESAS